jgi:hypothetical protein
MEREAIEKLDELDKRAEKDWYKGDMGSVYCKKSDHYPLFSPYGINANSVEMELVVEMRNALPALLAKHKQQQEALEALLSCFAFDGNMILAVCTDDSMAHLVDKEASEAVKKARGALL